MSWHARPTTTIHPVLGRKRIWKHRSKLVCVEQYIDGHYRPYYAMVQTPSGMLAIISTHRKLGPAKAACERTLRELTERERP